VAATLANAPYQVYQRGYFCGCITHFEYVGNVPAAAFARSLRALRFFALALAGSGAISAAQALLRRLGNRQRQ
jgi:hypothetical protein